ncbi:MAG: SagB/ThcOx family dehydrogenase [Anaerolineae bacterium]|nr:SagB/ThcOx family dehydrogenase [Anaerolineae bacterium]
MLEYHHATKHHFGWYARGPGRLDWTTQPDPFRRYRGAPLLALDHPLPDDSPPYDAVLGPDYVTPQPLSRRTISHFFYDSLALSAWKQAGGTRWALRVNPSSGNLHPTEGYMLSGPVEGMVESAIVAHYAPREHGVEIRAEVPHQAWQALAAGLPSQTSLIGLASIYWREAWKYGERAFRYCHLDVGHAIAALAMAAGGLGWQAALLDDVSTEEIAHLLGIGSAQGSAEREHADCLLAVYPRQGKLVRPWLPGRIPAEFKSLTWQGVPNVLSRGHVDWPAIDEVREATEKPPTDGVFGGVADGGHDRPGVRMEATPIQKGDMPSLRGVVRRRRSAVAMDPHGTIGHNDFFRILYRLLPVPGSPPFNALPWPPAVHLVLFVHRVDGLAPGLYCLARDPEQLADMQAAMRSDFTWTVPDRTPSDLPLYHLLTGDARAAARQLSCHQEIASDGAFAAAMIARFGPPLEHLGAWFYRRLYWECGAVGQMLYLGAETAGIRGTGIGCFFDDPVHDLLGLKKPVAGLPAYQSLYHFTVGHPVEDTRLATLPAYPDD